MNPSSSSGHLGRERPSIRGSSLGLVAGFAALLSLMAFLAWLGLNQIESDQRRLERIVNDHLAKIELASQMRTAARERTIIMQRMLLVDDPFLRDDLWMGFMALASDFIKARSHLMDMDLTPREQALLDRQSEMTRYAVPLQERVVELVAEDQPQQASVLLRAEANEAQDAVLEVLGELYELQRTSAQAAVAEAKANQRKARVVIVLISTLALLIGISIALVVVVTAYRAGRERDFLATHDALTGLPNRLLLHDRIERELVRAERGGYLTGLMFLDLDRFKVVNDTLGHSVGDRLLQAVAERLRECTRDSDTIARLGGDEFVVLVEQAHTEADFVRVAEKIIAAMGAPIAVDGHELYATTSIGISVYPSDGRGAFELLKHADTAMYHAKESGRNNFQFYSAYMSETVSQRLGFESSLRRALERDELRLDYQPIVEVASGRVIGAEALLRWEHAEYPELTPARFIPMLEETGLVVPVGEWVLRTACREANQLRRVTPHRPFRLAVNVSGRQLATPGFVSAVEESLREAGLKAGELELEITEGFLSSGDQTTLETLERLETLGVQLAIDDFGTGYSSLARLKELSIDRIKIDRSFIEDLTESLDDASIVSAILAMAHSLDIEVVAEGVERAAQLDILRRWGCHAVQGHLFSPAVSIEELTGIARRGYGALTRRRAEA